jgi:Ca2+-binding RTX toxin-like protein
MPSFYDRRNVDDVWIGSKKDDVMSGNGGDDVIQGMGGNDRIYGGTGNDRILGGDGNDFLQANQGDDMVAGGTGSDSVRGSLGTDELWGGNQGNLAGDGVPDYFIFDYQSDSRLGDGVDTIMDFHPEEGDLINIGGTVEGYGYHGSYDVQLVSDVSQLTHLTQQATLTYDANTGMTTLNLYFGDGDADIDMTLLIVGNHTTTAGFVDFHP